MHIPLSDDGFVRGVCESSDFPQNAQQQQQKGLILQYNYLSTNSPTHTHIHTQHRHTLITYLVVAGRLNRRIYSLYEIT